MATPTTSVPPTGTGATAAAAAPAPAPAAAAPEHFLQRIKLFSGLSILECSEVVKRMKRRDFPPNQIIVREGAPGNSMFFITAGQVEVRKKDTVTGIDFLLTEMGPGQNFGEMSLFDAAPRSATLQAETDVTLLVLDRPNLEELIESNPRAAAAFFFTLVQVFIERLRASGDLVAEVTRWGLEATGLDVDSR